VTDHETQNKTWLKVHTTSKHPATPTENEVRLAWLAASKTVSMKEQSHLWDLFAADMKASALETAAEQAVIKRAADIASWVLTFATDLRRAVRL